MYNAIYLYCLKKKNLSFESEDENSFLSSIKINIWEKIFSTFFFTALNNLHIYFLSYKFSGRRKNFLEKIFYKKIYLIQKKFDFNESLLK